MLKTTNNLARLLLGLTLLLSACSHQPEASTDSQASNSADMAGMADMPGMNGAAPVQTLATPVCNTTNIAQGRSATASSSENVNMRASYAVDGDGISRWSSAWNDPNTADAQWFQVNLGSVQQLCGVTLQWEGAYGKAFKLETSNDAVSWTPIYSTTTGTGGTQALSVTGAGQYIRMNASARGTGYGYSLLEFKVFSSAPTPPPSTAGYIPAAPPVTGVVPSTFTPPHAYFHEFQAQCAVSRSNLPDDPIIYPGKPGASHSHTFLGNRTTNALSTLASLQAGTTTCDAPGDKSAYWMPTMFNGDTPVMPIGTQTIYYKTGVDDYTSVRPFPPGLRFVVGNMNATPDEFLHAPGAIEGWECENSSRNATFPSCPAGGQYQLNIRYQAPSCWDGLNLDSPDHKRHMAYPINGRCTPSHPVAVPMIEFKMAFPAGADTSKVRLASGPAYSFHYDFFNAWDPATLQAMVRQCINGGLQCNSRGYDQAQPGKGAALGSDYLLH
jgi:Domain of unknown function (DUF1996)/F5/8 type C domain